MRKKLPKVLLLLAIFAALAAVKVFHLEQYLTLESLNSNRDAIQNYYESNPTQTIALYMTLYIITAALSIPGATILTLAGAAVFGFWLGLVVVSFASTVGGTCAFLASRFLLRDSIQNKFRDKLEGINEGVRREGAFYLFTLRLVPVFPFFLVNMVMGLTPIRTLTFFFVSQVGMLPGTAAYVNAGTQLSQIHSLKGILSFNVLISFAVIGVLPLLAKSIISCFRSRKNIKRFPRPKHYDYNVVVIGAGAAGLVSALIAAAVKAKVALIEKSRMGGDCLNTGCVPSKALIRAAKVVADARRGRDFGLKDTDLPFDFGEVMERVQSAIRKIEPHDSVERYTGLGVECIQGFAKVLSPFTVQVDSRTLTTRAIIIASGSGPAVPPIPGLDKIPFLTSDTVWELRTLPKRLLILGGGPIGCELAQAFGRFGSEVTIVEMASRLLTREDDDVSRFITERFSKEGIKVLTSHKAKLFVAENGNRALLCESESQEIRVEFDQVLLALGRKTRVTGFGLEELGVALSSRGTLATDEFLRTNYSNIFVCGDVAGPYQFTHVAAHQAWYASVNALFSPFKKFKADYRVIPWSTYTDPEVARVGLNESDAKEKGIPYQVTRYGMDDLDRAIVDAEDHGFIKVLTPPNSDKILGATIVGTHAADYLTEFVTAMKYGLGLNKILATIHIYPSYGEANKFAAGVWRKAHAPEKVLSYLEVFHRWRRTRKI